MTTALRRSLCARIHDARRSHDEIRVIDEILTGLEKGAELYGSLNLASDRRNWNAEAAEECRDALVYLACAKLAERDRRVAEIEFDASDAEPIALSDVGGEGGA